MADRLQAYYEKLTQLSEMSEADRLAFAADLEKNTTEAEQIELYAMINDGKLVEYKNPPYLVVSVTQQDEIFQRNMTMTAMVGYLFTKCEQYRDVDTRESRFADTNLINSELDNYACKLVANATQIGDYPDHFQQLYDDTNTVSTDAFFDQFPDTSELDTGDTVRQVPVRLMEQIHAIKIFAERVCIQRAIKELLDQIVADDDKRKKLDRLRIERDGIKRFLSELFEFDPNHHIAAAYDEEQAISDPTREPAKVAEIERELNGNDVENCVYTKNVPADTFAMFGKYMVSNYDKLAKCVQNLYGNRPNIYSIIYPYKVFQTKEMAAEWITKNQKRSCYILDTIEIGRPTAIGSWQKNEDAVSAYDEQQQILHNIMANEKDATAMHAKFQKRRVDKLRAKRGPMPDVVRSAQSVMNITDQLKSGYNLDADETDSLRRTEVYEYHKGRKVRKSRIYYEADENA
jgi:hypothetical protein